MIKARKFVAATDGKEGDRLTNQNQGKDIRLDRDLIGVVEKKVHIFADGNLDPVQPVELSGMCVGRPSVFVHGFFIDREMSGSISRLVAEHLLGFAFGFLQALGFKQMVFVVSRENKAMQDFMQDHGAKQQADGIVYTLRLDGEEGWKPDGNVR